MIKKLYRLLHPKFQHLFLDYPVAFQPRYGHGKPPHSGLLQVIEANRSSYETLLKNALEYKSTIHEIKPVNQVKDNIQPGWNNGFLPGLDIVILYTMLSVYKPARYIEIGSGNSTRVAFKAKTDQQLTTNIISIDPQPRAEMDQLADTIIRQPFESIDYDLVNQLQANDILFVDNSHRILPNSDAMVFFMEVLPRLKKGVIVHIHDIYLPYDYPQFMCDRFYSEQYGLAMYLLANPQRYQTLLPNYFISEDKALSTLIAPMWEHEHLQNVERHGGSYWLQIAE